MRHKFTQAIGGREHFKQMISIDTSFDFRMDTPSGKDPDALSPTLRRYHQALWSKELPSGDMFELDISTPGHYLIYRSGMDLFSLSSDAVIPTFTRWTRMQPIISQLPESENEDFRSIGYTMGGMMIWPSISAGGQRTINVERGFNRKIADRMDLTLECIRRHYDGLVNPMSKNLSAYAGYFELFGDFEGFVRFFLLDDLVEDDFSRVRFFMPFEDFQSRATPGDLETYREYRARTIAFVEARNTRIRGYVNANTFVSEN